MSEIVRDQSTHGFGLCCISLALEQLPVRTKAETITVAAIEAGVPNLAEAREIIAEFRRKAERDSAYGSSGLALVLSPRSPAASPRMRRPFALQ